MLQRVIEVTEERALTSQPNLLCIYRVKHRDNFVLLGWAWNRYIEFFELRLWQMGDR